MQPRKRPCKRSVAGTGRAVLKSAEVNPSQLPTVRRVGTGPEHASGTTAPAPLALGRYRLQRRLGAGAFGTVWMARDERLERDVAVKIVPRERIVGGRFEREARAAARLAHPGIVTLYEAAMDDEGAYLVSELVRGATLGRMLEQGRLSDRDIVTIAIALCDALCHAHAQGVVHRDVKPSNILIPRRPSSAANPAKLTDFGVARVVGGDSLTATGDVVGTAAYMSPEQAEGREAGAAADLYSLALVTYEALTGVNPVRTGTSAIRARRLGAHLPPLRRQRRELPRELGTSIDQALRPRARERGTVEELRSALESSLAQVGDAPGVVTSPWPRSGAGNGQVTPADGAAPGRGDPAPPAERASTERASTERDSAPPAAQQAPWPTRALAATAAAASTAWLAGNVLAPLPIAPAGAAVIAWLVVLVLPRIGWIALVSAVAGTAAAQGRPGGALVLLIGALAPALLMPRSGPAWPLPAGAPALGLAGLAGAWPAVAARASSSAWHRAVLGFCGYVWLVLASPMAAADLYNRRPAGIPPPDVWMASLSVTAHDVLSPIFDSGVLAAAPVWALAAVMLPWLVRGRSLPVDLVLVTIWAASTVSASDTVIALAHHGAAAPKAPSAIAGAIAGGLLALSPTLAQAWRSRHQQGSFQAELP